MHHFFRCEQVPNQLFRERFHVFLPPYSPHDTLVGTGKHGIRAKTGILDERQLRTGTTRVENTPYIDLANTPSLLVFPAFTQSYQV